MNYLILKKELKMRKSGHYWILFRWSYFTRGRSDNWEPTSYDSNSNSWALIGSRQTIPEGSHCIRDIGMEIIKPVECYDPNEKGK